jgi:hypothetical protein
MTGFIKSKSYEYTKHLYEKKIWEKENNKKLNLKKFLEHKKHLANLEKQVKNVKKKVEEQEIIILQQEIKVKKKKRIRPHELAIEEPHLLETPEGRLQLKFYAVEEHWGTSVAEWYIEQPSHCRICEKELDMGWYPCNPTSPHVTKKERENSKVTFDEIPCIDHNHNLGDRKAFKNNPNLLPRGLLCHHCNRGMGALKDDPKLLRKTLEYLEE